MTYEDSQEDLYRAVLLARTRLPRASGLTTATQVVAALIEVLDNSAPGFQTAPHQVSAGEKHFIAWQIAVHEVVTSPDPDLTWLQLSDEVRQIHSVAAHLLGIKDSPDDEEPES